MKTKIIKITGQDIIKLNGQDYTGAFKELGVNFSPRNDGRLDSAVCDMKFYVDLDFILRHGLMSDSIYEKYYKKSKQYRKYYNEGKQAFLEGKNCPLDNPYTGKTIKDADYWLDDLRAKGYPWYAGYRETQKTTQEKKYKLKQFQKEIKQVIKKYKLKLKYTDEYGTPYIETPDGYSEEIC